jgi:hypothetical protein
MHPAIIQAAAAERTRDQHAHATTCRRSAQARRARQSRPVAGAQRTGRGPWVLRVLRAA